VTIQKAAQHLRSRKVSSVELTKDALRRIGRLDGTLRTFITMMEEEALERANLADDELAQGLDRGPLHGMPVAVKDVFCTKGVRTTCGSKLFARFIPDHDAAVVEKLEAAGAVLVGKTNMHELAFGITSGNPHFGAVRNPWNLDCVPGGSSGGSGAAVAAGMVFMAMGSDTGGSIRIPASFCGTVGLKPTFGRVSRYGVMPLDFTLDHMGPLTRSVRDAAIVLNAIAGHDPRDETSSRRPVEDSAPAANISIHGIRIGLPENYYFEKADPEVVQAVRSLAEIARNLGARIIPIRVPDIEALNTIGRVILHSEAAAVMERYMDQRENFGTDVLALLDQGRLLAATDYVNAQRLRRMKQQEFRRVWQQVDCLFTPTTATRAPRIGQMTVQIGEEVEDVRLASTRFVRAMNVLGLPALSMRCGFGADGMPLGLQIIGGPFAEPLILRIAAVIEDNTGFHRRTPPDL
jgi:aspartyl-tRNA(Asn)/glutamyl-tRNA(Gln) amidotransferase subunit A